MRQVSVEFDSASAEVGGMSARQRKIYGAHYTPDELGAFMAIQLVTALYNGREDVELIRLLEPSVGDGSLVKAFLDRMKLNKASIRVDAFDTDAVAVEQTGSMLTSEYPQVALNIVCGDFLEYVVRSTGDNTLFSSDVVELYDAVISNPPWVRTQVLGSVRSKMLANSFGLKGRIDLYHAFLKATASVLRPGGLACIVVSNRFMTTQAGIGLRKDLLALFDVMQVWDFGDTRLFDAAVLPAVLLLRRKGGSSAVCVARFSAIYSVANGAVAQIAQSAISAVSNVGLVELPDGRLFEVRHGTLEVGEPGDVWRMSSSEIDGWLETVRVNTWGTFGDIGNIRVGVKTTADKVFISKDWDRLPEDERPELLMALTTHHTARRYRVIPNGKERQILYPHEVRDGNRRVVDLSQYPRTAAYLEKHRATLEARTYLALSNRMWYEIWVPQDPAAWPIPKLVFRDIAERPMFWLDMDGTIINGDCYWIIPRKPNQLDLLWLALAVANSTFIEEFYDNKFNNKLYAGRRRFMTQYVQAFPLPAPDTKIAREIVRMVQVIYNSSDDRHDLEEQLDKLVRESFGLPVKEVGR